MLLGNGDGTFLPAVTYAVGMNPQSVGGPDRRPPTIIAANRQDGTVSVLRGTTSGTFEQAADTYTVGNNPTCLIVANLSGQLDVVTTNSGSHSISVLRGNGDGTFQQTTDTYQVGINPQSVTAGNINGHLSLVVANAYSNSVSVLRGIGDGTFQAASSYSVGDDAYGVTAGDFNNDGISTSPQPISATIPSPSCSAEPTARSWSRPTLE